MMKKILLILIILLLLPTSSYAAEYFFGVDTKDVAVGEKMNVGVFIDTQGAPVNAVEGTITFNPDLFSFDGVQNGSSVITLWVQQPTSAVDGKVTFAGLMPGGYVGDKGYLFSIILRAKKIGTTVISSSNEKILLNDGTGVEATTQKAPISIMIQEQKEQGSTPAFEPLYDPDPPQQFQLRVAKDENIFSGKWFLVFQAQDKGSGIDHYEILEKPQLNSVAALFYKEAWVIGESPYLLQDQTLESVVLVKAFDRAGNSTIAALPAQEEVAWYKNSWMFGIIILITLLFCGYLLIKKFFKKKSPGL